MRQAALVTLPTEYADPLHLGPPDVVRGPGSAVGVVWPSAAKDADTTIQIALAACP